MGYVIRIRYNIGHSWNCIIDLNTASGVTLSEVCRMEVLLYMPKTVVQHAKLFYVQEFVLH